jgi:uncharacterized membrane protein
MKTPFRKLLVPFLGTFGVLAAILLDTKPANAWFEVCNKSTRTAQVAYAHVYAGWNSEGWWYLKSGDCARVYGGDLANANRYFYVYAKSLDGKAVWSGNNNFCVVLSGTKFGLKGADKRCGGNGTFVGFQQVDTGNSRNYTYSLTE